MNIVITQEMIDAGVLAKMENDGEYADVAECVLEIYRAMVSKCRETCEAESDDSLEP